MHDVLHIDCVWSQKIYCLIAGAGAFRYRPEKNRKFPWQRVGRPVVI